MTGWLSCVLLLLFAVPGARAADPSVQGLPVHRVLDEYRNNGLDLVYSTNLVTDDLLVVEQPVSDDPVQQAIEILHRIGLTIIGDFIISPDYTEEKFDKLSAFVKQQQIDLPMHTILTPLPGTVLYQQLKEQIILHDLDYYTLTNAVLPTRLDEELFYQRYAALLTEGHQSAKV